MHPHSHADVGGSRNNMLNFVMDLVLFKKFNLDL